MNSETRSINSETTTYTKKNIFEFLPINQRFSIKNINTKFRQSLIHSIKNNQYFLLKDLIIIKNNLPNRNEIITNVIEKLELYIVNLTDSDINDDGMKYLSESKCLAQVTTLNLNNNQIGPDGMKYLSESKYLTKISKIY